MGKIRIIGGIHRSRQLKVVTATDLRPTLDRVKETLFNWLGQDLTAKTCLDLFAGSGSLGFEAISRNAAAVVMVEKNLTVVQQLKTNAQLLKAANCQITHADALKFLATTMATYDVIFLDPPYSSDLLAKSLALASQRLKANGIIYIEYLKQPDLTNFAIVKQGLAGTVNYALLQLKE